MEKPFKFNFCIEGELMSSKTATFTVTVKPAVQPNPIVLSPDGGTLPDETVGVVVSDPVTVVSGGVPPFSFAVTAGALPPGTSLTGTPSADGMSELVKIEGTPTQEGTGSFDLTVTDSLGALAT